MRQFSLLLRATVCACAALMAALGVWVLAAQFSSPQLPYFPTDRAQAENWTAAKASAVTAAHTGTVRGDLWTIAAITTAAPLLFEPFDGRQQDSKRAQVEEARATAEQAAKLSPHDSRAWLILAALDARLGDDTLKTAEALKLSYYTAPNEFALMPLRLKVAVQSDAINDDELQVLVQAEIQRMIANLKPAIMRAYQDARPKGREIVEAALAASDPDFLATLPAKPQ